MKFLSKMWDLGSIYLMDRVGLDHLPFLVDLTLGKILTRISHMVYILQGPFEFLGSFRILQGLFEFLGVFENPQKGVSFL